MAMSRVWPPLFAVLLMFVGSGVAQAQEAQGVLEGAVFDGVLREAGATSGGDADRLIFRDGLFISEACKDYGFEESAYTASQEADLVRFEATSFSPTHGKMVWHGIRRGDRIEAEVIWTKERWYWDIRREYQFLGQLTTQP